MIGIPLKPLRKILGQNCPFHISEDATLVTRDLIEYILHQVRISAIKEFEDLNSNREHQGLKPLKRLNGRTVRRACNNILKPNIDNDMGLQYNSIVSLGGNTMYTNIDATKSAKKDTDKHGGTNGP